MDNLKLVLLDGTPVEVISTLGRCVNRRNGGPSWSHSDLNHVDCGYGLSRYRDENCRSARNVKLTAYCGKFEVQQNLLKLCEFALHDAAILRRSPEFSHR